MKKLMIKGLLITTLSLQPMYCNMPVFDFSNLTQAILEYSEQIKEMIMFEKQLEELGVDVSQISSFISNMQSMWDSLQNLNQQALNLSGMESLINDIKSDCDELQEKSENFKKYIQEQVKKLNGLDSKTAEKQACMNALTDEKFNDEVKDAYYKSADEAYKNGDMDKFRAEIEKGEEVKRKRNRRIAQMQDESIQKVLTAYNQYAEKSAEDGTTKYNMIYRKDIQKLLNEIMKEIGKEGNNINGMNEKQRQQALLRIQSLMLQVLISQYEVTQSMNAMFASMAVDKTGSTKEVSEKQDMKKASHVREVNFKKNELGLPDILGTSINQSSK